MFMVMLDPSNLYLATKQPSREPNLEPACDSSRQISSLLHGSCSQAVLSLIMCDPNTLHVCCVLGAKQPLCLWLVGSNTTYMCMVICEQNNFYVIVILEPINLYVYGYLGDKLYIFVIVICGIKQLQGLQFICEPNNIYSYGYLGAKQPQFGSQTTFKEATSGTFLCVSLEPKPPIFMVSLEPKPHLVCYG